MINIMLGKKELAPIIAILICVIIYFVYEYYTNQKKLLSEKIEGFQTQMHAKKLDEQREINIQIFSNYKKYALKEKEFYRNDIDVANYFIKKKFNLDQILRKSKMVNGEKIYINNPKTESLLNTRSAYLSGMIEDIEKIVEHIDNLGSDNKFYEMFKNMLFEYRAIYSDKLSYFNSENTNYLNLNLINENNEADYSKLGDINTYSISSRNLFKNSTESLEKEANTLVKFVDSSTNIDKSVKNIIIDLIQNRLQITLKMVVRSLSFDFIDNIVILGLSGDVSDAVKDERMKAARESNVIVGELVELLNMDLENAENMTNFFRSGDKGSIILVDNEFKYFNTVDKNTNTLVNFCKKMKKMDRPSNNNLIFKRMAREFVKKKNDQIIKLNEDINQIMGEMSIKEAYNQNLYTLRTSDEAQKQINAIKQAKENIDSIGKFKINLK